MFPPDALELLRRLFLADRPCLAAIAGINVLS
jgi:hypothetical protein